MRKLISVAGIIVIVASTLLLAHVASARSNPIMTEKPNLGPMPGGGTPPALNQIQLTQGIWRHADPNFQGGFFDATFYCKNTGTNTVTCIPYIAARGPNGENIDMGGPGWITFTPGMIYQVYRSYYLPCPGTISISACYYDGSAWHNIYAPSGTATSNTFSAGQITSYIKLYNGMNVSSTTLPKNLPLYADYTLKNYSGVKVQFEPCIWVRGPNNEIADMGGVGKVVLNAGQTRKFNFAQQFSKGVRGDYRLGSDLQIAWGPAAYRWHDIPAGESGTNPYRTVTVVSAVYSTWYLAEGSTAWGLGTRICIANPNANSVHAEITYMTSSGPIAGGTVSMPAKSRATIYPEKPKDPLGLQEFSGPLQSQDFSTKVVCKEGQTICVDRTMSWAGEAHSSVGVNSPSKTWYLAEGSSKWGFETWLLIQNPNASRAKCTLTYMIEGSTPKTVTKVVKANSRASFFMADDIGSADASIKVESDQPVISERSMYRTSNGKREGSNSMGTTNPSKDYFLAEGTTAWGFTTYVLVQNPNTNSNKVTITYMTPAGPKTQPTFRMPANSRTTIRANDILPEKDLSVHVQGTLPLIAERSMYWNGGIPSGEACHNSMGLDSPHTTFYFPDGQSSRGWETWILVQNPNNTDVTVQITYMTPTGEGNVITNCIVPANSRCSVYMADSIPAGKAAIMVDSKTTGGKVMAERSMYCYGRYAGTVTTGGYSDPD